MVRSRLLRLAALFVLLLALPVLLPPAKADVCITYGTCESTCPATTEKRPCRIVQCGTEIHKTCGTCTTHCILPPD